MPQFLSFLATSIAVPALIAILSAWFSARWAARSVLTEKWWDRKLHSYTEIIEALHHLVWYSEILKTDYELMEHAVRAPKKAELRDRYFDAQLKIRKAMDVGPFIISEDAARVLRTLSKQTECAEHEIPPEVILDSQRELYRAALRDIRTCADKDLHRNWLL